MTKLLLYGAMAGIAGTLAMDLGAGLMRASRLAAGVPLESIGKWFASVLRGQPFHESIALSPIPALPLPAVMLMHYAIGAALGIGFVMLLTVLGVTQRRWAWALGYGLLTNALPWLVMFPAMGYGFFGAQGPAEFLLLRSSLLNHLWYGAGLALFVTLF